MKTLLTFLTVIMVLSFTQTASAHDREGRRRAVRGGYDSHVVKAYFGFGRSHASWVSWYDQRYYGKRPFFRRGPYWKKFYRKASYRPFWRYGEYRKHRHENHRHDRDRRHGRHDSHRQNNWYDRYWD